MGSLPVALEFLTSYENSPRGAVLSAERRGRLRFGPDGTLLVCDEKRGRVHALDPRDLTWYVFDQPASRPYQPLDAVYDGFKVLVLDQAGASIQRFEPGGAWLDELVDLRRLDPGDEPLATALAIDRDGRFIIGDAISDSRSCCWTRSSTLHLRVGGPGSLSDQFGTPSGLVFLVDGGFVVADRGNRRLCRYDRKASSRGQSAAISGGQSASCRRRAWTATVSATSSSPIPLPDGCTFWIAAADPVLDRAGDRPAGDPARARGRGGQPRRDAGGDRPFTGGRPDFTASSTSDETGPAAGRAGSAFAAAAGPRRPVRRPPCCWACR